MTKSVSPLYYPIDLQTTRRGGRVVRTHLTVPITFSLTDQ
jgi:hypothetical protein